ncbi:MAG: carboxypeptidase-like regulatory domain-containing protein [Gemmatimonadota bacterium]
MTRVLCVVLTLVALGAEAATGQAISGRVVNPDREGIQNAFVELLTADDEQLAGVFTDGNGRFRIQLMGPVARHVLAIGAIGHSPRSWEVPQVAPNDLLDLGDLQLQIQPIALSSLDVRVTRSRLTPGREWIRRRQLLGRGKFFPGAVLTAANPRSLSVYLSERTELWVEYDMRGTPSVYVPSADCTLVFVNEWPMNANVGNSVPRPRVGVESIDRPPANTALELQNMGFPSLDHVPLEWIAAVEVYESLRDVPPGRLQFSSSGAHSCAIVNVWTWNSW